MTLYDQYVGIPELLEASVPHILKADAMEHANILPYAGLFSACAVGLIGAFVALRGVVNQRRAHTSRGIMMVVASAVAFWLLWPLA